MKKNCRPFRSLKVVTSHTASYKTQVLYLTYFFCFDFLCWSWQQWFSLCAIAIGRLFLDMIPSWKLGEHLTFLRTFIFYTHLILSLLVWEILWRYLLCKRQTDKEQHETTITIKNQSTREIKFLRIINFPFRGKKISASLVFFPSFTSSWFNLSIVCYI